MEFFLTTVLKLIPFFENNHFDRIYKYGVGTDFWYIASSHEAVPY